MAKSKQIVVADTPQKDMSSVDSFIAQAIASNAPVETLERLFALHKEVKAEQAKAAFVQALTGFQKDCPIIEKTKAVLNKDRTVRYRFAPIDLIIEKIKNALATNGLSYRWEAKQEKGIVTAICFITHIDGHTESSAFTVETDTDSYMSSPQKAASALTYAKRYSLTNALGIATGEEDTDATDVRKEPDAKSVKTQIVTRLRRLGYETGEKTVVEETVKNLTQLDLVEKNFAEIASRLQAIVTEREEYDHSKV